MKTPICRLSIFALSLGLTAPLTLGSTLAWAAPPDADVPGADAPAPDAPGPDDTAGPESGPESAPETGTELAPEPAPEPEPEPGADVSHPESDGDKGIDINPLQGSEARPPSQKIQVPVDIGDKHSITYTSLLAPRINPLGLEERLWIGYQYRLYDTDKAILNGSNIGIFLRPVVNPAIALLGATLQIQPAAVFRLRATYSFVQWYGNFQYMQSYQSPHDDYSDTRLDAQADAGENYVTNGHQVELEALVQARYKGLVLRSGTFGIYNYYNNLRGDDDLFYAVRYDTLAPARGWLLTNDTDLMWLQDLKGPRNSTAMFGVRASTVMPIYNDDVYEEGDVIDNPNGPQFRLGPVLGYIFYDRPDRYPRFNRPTLLVMPQWNIKHRWRTGRDVSTAFPTIVIAFVFTGQLWGKN